jgi:hypothetical protein
MSARLEKIYKKVNKLSTLITAKDAKNAKHEHFLRHIFALDCDFTSAQICGLNLPELFFCGDPGAHGLACSPARHDAADVTQGRI